MKNSNEVFRITGDWAKQSRELKLLYSQLTDEDLKFEPGKENELVNRIEKRLHKKRTDVIALLEYRNKQPL